MAPDARYRLRRAKSTPSVQKRRQAPMVAEPLDPEVAKRHALAAASCAMAHARERTSNDSRGSGDQQRGDEKPVNFSVPQRRRQSSIRCTDDDGPVSRVSAADISTPAVGLSSENDQSVDLTVREFQCLDFQDCSAPSSYRRLRKARSMFSTRLRGGTAAAKTSKETNSESQTIDVDDENEHNRPLRHSMSFFHGNDPSSGGLRRIKSQSAAAQLARSHLFENKEAETEHYRRPSLLSRRHPHEQKPFRKTFRTTRDMSPDDDASPAGTRWSSGTGLHMKARAFSITIKKRLRQVFGRSQFNEESPEPQLASPSNLDGSVMNRWDMQSNPGAILSERFPLLMILHRFSHVVSDENRPPTIRTMRSSDSISTSVSRVTSWTDSTAGNTVTTRHTADRNRLSIIQENGDIDYGCADYDDYPIGRTSTDPPKRTSTVQYKGRPIDSQRVYSALMKRIHQTAAKDGERIVSAGTVKGGPAVPERASSICSQYSNRTAPQTPSDVSMKTARTSFGVDLHLQSVQSRSSLRSDYPGENYNVPRGSSVRRSKISLREPESTFFPSTAFAKPETPSPYRLAMNSIRESEDHSEDESGSVIMSKTVRTGSASDSPSVYSRTPSGHILSQESLPFDSDAFERPQPGMATIFTSHGTSYNSPKIGSFTAETRAGPTAEWKSWMNSQINKIDDSGSCRLPRGPLSRDHYREEAQIDGEGQQTIAVDDLRVSVGREGRASPRAKEMNISRNISDRSPLMELQIPGRSNFSRPLSRQTNTPVTLLPRLPSDGSVRVAPGSFQTHGYPSSSLISSPDRFSLAKSNESIDNPESPTPRRTLRASREARWHRSPVTRSTIRPIVDKNDAKAVQFRSIRSIQDNSKLTKENMRNFGASYDTESAEMHQQLQGIHSTIDSKRMVDLFLSSRRGQREDSEDAGTGPVFL
jgi:hypothetical protein